MLSLFPSLLTYGLFGPFILRLTLGAILAYWGYRGFMTKDTGDASGTDRTQAVILGIVDAVTGVLLIVGFLTQFAALVAVVILGMKLVHKAMAKSLFTDGVNYYFILFVIALSLLVSGAGFYAFDLPL